MMKRISLVLAILAVLGLTSVSTAVAGDWRFPVGLTYINGIVDIVDQHKDNLEAQGYDVEGVDGMPVGISAQPYYLFDSGLGIGGGIGPTMFIFGDTEFTYIPVNVCLRYFVSPKDDTSLYLRAGLSYGLASGDYVDSSQPGFLGAVGLEFLRNRRVGFGFELGYDSATITLEDHTGGDPDATKDFQSIGFMASVFVVF